MKLLFDAQLSPRLVEALEADFPGALHVATLGLDRAADATVFEHAARAGLLVVTKDADFFELALAKRRGRQPAGTWRASQDSIT